MNVMAYDKIVNECIFTKMNDVWLKEKLFSFKFYQFSWTTTSKGESANRSMEPMCSVNHSRPDHNHRQNPLLFTNSDVGSLTSPTKP